MTIRVRLLTCGTMALWMAGRGLAAAQVPPAASAASPAVDVNTVIKAAEQTREQMSTKSSSWQVTIDLDKGPRVDASVLQTASARCITLTVKQGASSQEVYQITDRNDLQYVKQFGRPLGKFRPHEAPLVSPSYSFFLELAGPLVVNEAVLRGATFERASGDVATYVVPLPESTAQQLRSMIQTVEQAIERASAEPDYRPDEKTQENLATIKEMLAKGKPLDIDTKLGIIRRMVAPTLCTVMWEAPEFRNLPPESFRVDDTRWKDYSDDPLKGVNPDDLVMIGCNGAWQPGAPRGETECRLLNVRTGKFRRIPFEGAQCFPACFLKGRTSVAVLGMEPMKGTSLGLFEVNLKTRENRRLGEDLLENQHCLGAALSPDGRTLAAIASKGLTESDICLIDLATNKARVIGKCYTMTISWCPDGKQLVVGHSIDREPGRKPRQIICRMNLQGELTRIHDGEDPVLLADGKSILFQDDEGNWQTCDLEGKKVAPYASEMPAAKRPTPCPDGQRILWLCPDQGRFVPRVGNVGSSRLSPIAGLRGYWDRPHWR